MSSSTCQQKQGLTQHTVSTLQQHSKHSNMQSSFLGTSSGLRAGRCFAPSRVSPAAPTVVAHYGGKANLGGGKPWERTQLNHNGKPVKIDMHVKKGDIVQVRTQQTDARAFLVPGWSATTAACSAASMAMRTLTQDFGGKGLAGLIICKHDPVVVKGEGLAGLSCCEEPSSACSRIATSSSSSRV